MQQFSLLPENYIVAFSAIDAKHLKYSSETLWNVLWRSFPPCLEFLFILHQINAALTAGRKAARTKPRPANWTKRHILIKTEKIFKILKLHASGKTQDLIYLVVHSIKDLMTDCELVSSLSKGMPLLLFNCIGEGWLSSSWSSVSFTGCTFSLFSSSSKSYPQ